MPIKNILVTIKVGAMIMMMEEMIDHNDSQMTTENKIKKGELRYSQPGS